VNVDSAAFFITKSMSREKGFTLIEVMIVVTIIVILAAALVPKIVGHADSAVNGDAIAFCNAVNRAKSTYRATVDDAETIWNNAGSEAMKYSLLVNAGLMEGYPASLNATTVTFNSKSYSVLTGYPNSDYAYFMGSLTYLTSAEMTAYGVQTSGTCSVLNRTDDGQWTNTVLMAAKSRNTH